jgi:hypothetical protein
MLSTRAQKILTHAETWRGTLDENAAYHHSARLRVCHKHSPHTRSFRVIS